MRLIETFISSAFFRLDAVMRLRLLRCTAIAALNFVAVFAGSLCVAQESTLTLLPAESTLSRPYATQQLIVEEVHDNAFSGDRSASAKPSSSDEHIATVDDHGLLRRMANGRATITATAQGQ